MNIIFALVLTVSSVFMLIYSPNLYLSTLLNGGQKALELTLKLTVVYAIWFGLFEFLKETKLTEKLAKSLRPFNKLLFGNISDKANDYVSLNISANILGISGVTTPMGIKSVLELEKSPDTDYAIKMFFVINATSIQLIPSSVLALRSSMSSASPADIIIPTVLATTVSTVIGFLLVKIFIKQK